MKSNLQAINLYGVHVCLVFVGVQLVDNGDCFHRELGRKSSSCVKTSGRCRGRWEEGRRRKKMGGGRWGGGVSKGEPVLSCQLFDHGLL